MTIFPYPPSPLFDMLGFKKEKVEPNFVVVEGISGLWHYHISTPDKRSRGLCGAQTMYTSIPVAHWGMKFGEHFPKRPTWCKQCEELHARGD